MSHVFKCPLGLPQSSNLGPDVFLLYTYVSYLHKPLVGSHFLMYTDDLKLYREIRDEHDQELMQIKDIERLVNWSDKKKLPLNIKNAAK